MKYLTTVEKPLRIVYEWLNERTHGAVRIFRIALKRFSDSNAAQASAGMAFYAFFSISPLLLFLIIGASFWLENEVAYSYVMSLIVRLLPTAQLLIEANIKQVLELRGTVGLIGLVGFLWSSLGFFSILTRNINRAQPGYTKRNFLEDRALAFGMVGILTILFGISFLSNTITSFIPKINLFYWGKVPLHETVLWRYIIRSIPFLTTLFMLYMLYRFGPKNKLGWLGAFIAAAIAAVAWQIATKVFTWLLEEGILKYELVYGSLGTIVALMFWIYLISTIALFGAHLSVVINEKLGR
ncbi:MAG TPA: YihY/virulence factor BrkB family protein [Anaerolineae bacterium]|nr:YihY/virulence factor BrkB family protein [Anaerolineae bacterium]